MLKCDTWPSHTGLESSSNMNSAGSCDSVISMNSGYSEDSMEHLSPEERACLVYFEETIEALELQEDSGFSNDELDLREPINEYSGLSNESGMDHRSFLTHESPTPLSHPAAEPESAQSAFANLTLNSEPQENAKDHQTVESLTPPTDSVTSTDPKKPSAVIPPPSDFMDNLDSESKSERVKYHPPSVPAITRPGLTVDVEQLRQRAMTPTVNVEQLRQRAASRRTSLSPPPSERLHVRSPSNISLTPSTASTSTSNVSSPLMSRSYVPPSPPLSPFPEFAELRSPPAVAPKPKLLPANILLKAHKAAEDRTSGHVSTPSSERNSVDHHQVHMEALRKLGLLRSFEEDSTPGQRQTYAPKTRYSWAAPSLALSPPASTHPLLAQSHSRVNSLPQVVPSAAALSSFAPPVPLPDILPAPPAFSDTTEPLHSDKKHANAITPSALISQLPRKATGIKSATLERSGVGLGSSMNSVNSREFNHRSSGGQMHPPLYDGLQDWSDYDEESQVSDGASTDSEVPCFIPPYPASYHPEDLQDLPRSQGVSVVISPHAENENDRREALRKLGLLRD